MKRLDKLKIIAYVHMAPPEHCAGSEMALFAILRGMVARGHSVKVIVDEISREYDIDGIKILKPPMNVDRQFWAQELFEWADVGITHLNLTSSAMRAAKDAGKPLVHLVHNHNQLRFHGVRAIRAQLLMFNSQWVYEQNKADAEAGTLPALGPSMVVHPIVEPDRYRGTRGEWTTLVSMTATKGSGVFYELAKRMPGIKFLGIKGCYGEQHIDEGQPNVFIGEHSADINRVYQRTKVILMPSDYESYGRVAVEAACSGIPSIVHPTPGLKEALGEAGIYIDRNDIDAWQKELARLYDEPEYYAERSAAALALADSLRPEEELDRAEAALKIVANFGIEGSEQTVEALGEIEYCRRAKEGGFFDPAREPRGYRPPLGGSPNRPPFVADQTYWMSATGQVVTHFSPDKLYLLIAKGQEMPYDQAITLLQPASGPFFDQAVSLGLVKLEPNVQEKAMSAPPEIKAFLSPAEDKVSGVDSDLITSEKLTKAGLITPGQATGVIARAS